jgi:hypothetical protein
MNLTFTVFVPGSGDVVKQLIRNKVEELGEQLGLLLDNPGSTAVNDNDGHRIGTVVVER